ncbi:MAG: ABC-F family ATP-binding cassette domain-containing protein [Stackebrandtia sp.]
MSTSVVLNDVAFAWPDGAKVFDGLEFVASDGRTALIGANGAGKTTLLRLLTGELKPARGFVAVSGELAYLPQELPLRLDARVDELLGVAEARKALRAIESGDADAAHFAAVGDDWDVEERARAQLDRLGLDHVELDRTVSGLSGGESMLVGLAGRLLRRPRVLVLDEPTNNLDVTARRRLYRAVDEFAGTLLIVSHDRELLRRVDAVAELRDGRVRTFEGGFDAYERAIAIEQEAAERMVRVAKADVDKQKRELVDVQVKLARRTRYGKKMYEQKREPRAVMKERKRQAQVSAAKLKDGHQDDLDQAKQRLNQAEEKVRDDAEIRVDLPETEVPAGRDVFVAQGVDRWGLWGEAGFDLHVRGPERIGLLGANGAGKTTLLRMLAGELEPDRGSLRMLAPARYLPQRLELLDDALSVFDNVKRLAPDRPDALLRNRLARFLFRGDKVMQPAATLSGGERLRAALAAVVLAEPTPQLLMLDEPTNNLDLAGVKQLEQALTAFQGALIAVSHDPAFLRAIGVTRWLLAERGEGLREVDGP